jgi:hypothetical protein
MGPPGVNGGLGPSSMSKQSKRSLNNKRVSPMRERSLDTSQQMMNYNLQPGSGAARIMNASYGNGGGSGKFPVQSNPMNRTAYVGEPQMRNTGSSINSSGFMSDDNRQVQKRKVQVVSGQRPEGVAANGTGPLGTTINNNNIVININKNYQGNNNGAASKVLNSN